MRGNTIFNQIMQLISLNGFKQSVDRYSGDRYTKSFNCWQQLIVLLYSQARGLKSLRDITISLRSQHRKWYHLGMDKSEVETVLSNISSRGLLIETTCDSEDEARELIKKCETWSRA